MLNPGARNLEKVCTGRMARGERWLLASVRIHPVRANPGAKDEEDQGQVPGSSRRFDGHDAG